MKILTVVGARPQFVKAAVVSRALLGIAGVTETIVHTGQHFDDNMSTIFFDELSIPRPKHNLGVGGGSHASNTGRMMEGIEQLMLSDQPDFVLVYGDTDSTLAAALAAAKLCVKVAHVEAGLRSFNRNMPEEINRIMTDHVSTMLFPPTQAAVEQLAREGIVGDKVKNVGDVMFDAIRLFNPIAETKSSVLADLALEKGTYALCTLHRKFTCDYQRTWNGRYAHRSAATPPHQKNAWPERH
jgi:UDP-GlcNAc3NAcA epimerase